MAKGFSTKKLAIDKANATIVLAVAITTFLTVFSLVASKALYSQMRYQSKVSSKKEQALKTLQGNLETADQLTTAYKAFSEETVNVLGGNPSGDADRDGDNPRIILDALPSKYDFPALTTSVEKLLKDNGFSITTISGSDDEITQSAIESAEDPQVIDMPFSVEVTTTDQRGKNLMQLFEKSIRPMQIEKLVLSSQSGQLKATITAKTYFQPEKSLNVKSEVVK
jgi:hypothetical protein